MSDAMESLYPFLYSDTSDLSAVLDQVRASTVAKAAEIGELRRAVGARDGARIAECAREAAASGRVHTKRRSLGFDRQERGFVLQLRS